MYSWVAKTEEIDDLEIAVNEIKEQVDKMPLKANSVGIAYVYYDADFDELSELLEENFDFPVIGVSTIAMLDKEGYFEYGIELLVLSADDVQFGVGLAENLCIDTIEEDITREYNRVKSLNPNMKEELILTYISKMISYSGDFYTKILDQLSNGAPIVGGMASDMFNYRSFKVFSGKQVYAQGIVFILVYGNIRPIAVAESSVSNVRRIGNRVTEAKGNIVYKLGDETVAEMLDREGLSTEAESGNIALEYMQTPFVVETPVNESETVEALRNIISLNREDGTAQFLGNIPVGSSIKVSSMRTEDIGKSVNEAFAKLLSRINDSSDYKYSTLICTSCTGRYINLVGDKDMEAKAYKDIIPDDISIIGMYSYGELCPIQSQVSDRIYNLFHNETFTILAI